MCSRRCLPIAMTSIRRYGKATSPSNATTSIWWRQPADKAGALFAGVWWGIAASRPGMCFSTI